MDASINDVLPVEIITMILNLTLYPPIIYEVCGLWQQIIKVSYNSAQWDMCTIAAEHGYFSVLQWARSRKYGWYENTDLLAAQSGNIELWKWARINGCPKSSNTCFALAYRGMLKHLKWAHSQGDPLKGASMGAARGGHLNILKWIRIKLQCPISGAVCHYAILGGHLDVLRWLVLDIQKTLCSRDMKVACKKCHLDIMKWLYAGCGFSPHPTGYKYAIMNRRKDVVEWLLKVGCPYGQHAMKGAMYLGDIDVIKELPQVISLTEHSIIYAARRNRANVIEWLITKGIRCNGATINLIIQHAVLDGHVDVLNCFDQYIAIGSQFPCIGARETAIAAARRGHVNVLDWLLHKLGGRFDDDLISNIQRSATRRKHVAVIQWLERECYAFRERQKLNADKQ